jgi:hypothetical protein
LFAATEDVYSSAVIKRDKGNPSLRRRAIALQAM